MIDRFGLGTAVSFLGAVAPLGESSIFSLPPVFLSDCRPSACDLASGDLNSDDTCSTTFSSRLKNVVALLFSNGRVLYVVPFTLFIPA